jgi:hypothetical protein
LLLCYITSFVSFHHSSISSSLTLSSLLSFHTTFHNGTEVHTAQHFASHALALEMVARALKAILNERMRPEDSHNAISVCVECLNSALGNASAPFWASVSYLKWNFLFLFLFLLLLFLFLFFCVGFFFFFCKIINNRRKGQERRRKERSEARLNKTRLLTIYEGFTTTVAPAVCFTLE